MAAFEIIALDPTTPQLRAPGAGDTYTAPRALALAPEGLTGSSATSSLAIEQTWNTTGTPTALDISVAWTAANNAAALIRARDTVSNQTHFEVQPKGVSILPSPVIFSNNARQFSINNTGLRIKIGTPFGWSNNNADQGTFDLQLHRDAANTLALRNSTNAQAFNIYNTYTDASNYERGFIRYSGNVLQIGHEAAGTGSGARATRLSGGAGTGNYLEISQFNNNFAFANIAKITFTNASVQVADSSQFGFSPNGGSTSPPDTGLGRSAAGVVKITNGGSGAGSLEFNEQTAPAAPAANGVRVYAEDNGAGKTRLMALFATGAAQQIAIEP